MISLCGDIGGTNANLCVSRCSNQIELDCIDHLSTQEYLSFSDLINAYLETCDEKPTSACFAVAGVVKDQRVEMTNASLVVDAREILANTPLKRVKVINDFDAVGYAINVLDPSDFIVLNEGEVEEKGVKCALGAGTGLGKSLLLYDEELKSYLPVSSEGGHSDFPIASEKEWIFVENLPQPTWENLISGSGIERIYQSLQKHRYPNEPRKMTAKEISEKRHDHELCKETFKWFVKFYARAARNFSIELLAKGGVYLAGGIGASNQDVFGSLFMEEFTRHHLPLFRELLRKIPVNLITNYEISLKGAAFAQVVHSENTSVTHISSRN
ncbi:glucokinase [Waddlia chondrophila 2032/99]|uniref:Glucokinase n=1 Tax=Waddlia chondrophila 2032/99 TaxID=765953 RepID=F8LCG5_9BACT|nr:glucokinase [Waddlia chondrophila 2032/99]